MGARAIAVGVMVPLLISCSDSDSDSRSDDGTVAVPQSDPALAQPPSTVVAPRSGVPLGELPPSTPEELAYAYCLAQFDDRFGEVVEAEIVDGVAIDREQMAIDFETCVAAGYPGAATDLRLAHCEGFYDPAATRNDCE